MGIVVYFLLIRIYIIINRICSIWAFIIRIGIVGIVYL